MPCEWQSLLSWWGVGQVCTPCLLWPIVQQPQIWIVLWNPSGHHSAHWARPVFSRFSGLAHYGIFACTENTFKEQVWHCKAIWSEILPCFIGNHWFGSLGVYFDGAIEGFFPLHDTCIFQISCFRQSLLKEKVFWDALLPPCSICSCELCLVCCSCPVLEVWDSLPVAIGVLQQNIQLLCKN